MLLSNRYIIHNLDPDCPTIEEHNRNSPQKYWDWSTSERLEGADRAAKQSLLSKCAKKSFVRFLDSAHLQRALAEFDKSNGLGAPCSIGDDAFYHKKNRGDNRRACEEADRRASRLSPGGVERKQTPKQLIGVCLILFALKID